MRLADSWVQKNSVGSRDPNPVTFKKRFFPADFFDWPLAYSAWTAVRCSPFQFLLGCLPVAQGLPIPRTPWVSSEPRAYGMSSQWLARGRFRLAGTPACLAHPHLYTPATCGTFFLFVSFGGALLHRGRGVHSTRVAAVSRRRSGFGRCCAWRQGVSSSSVSLHVCARGWL